MSNQTFHSGVQAPRIRIVHKKAKREVVLALLVSALFVAFGAVLIYLGVTGLLS